MALLSIGGAVYNSGGSVAMVGGYGGGAIAGRYSGGGVVLLHNCPRSVACPLGGCGCAWLRLAISGA